jgi:hypothetical protein
MKDYANDPVHEDDGWWFWDETWAHRYGPYKTEANAREALRRYVDALDAGDRPQPLSTL